MKQNFFHSIKSKLILLIAIVISLISVFVYIYFPQSFEFEQIKAIESRVISLANIASYSVGTAILFDDKEATQDQINSLLKSEGIEYIVIQTPADSIYYIFNPMAANQCDYINCENSSITSDNSVFKVKNNIELNEEILGTLYLGYSLKELNASVENLKSNIAWVSLIIFSIGLIAVFYIGSFITQPITTMVGVVEKVSTGDLTIRSKIYSSDEIGYLSNSFNSMIDRIENSKEELKTINRDLEFRVDERTKELSASMEKAESAVRMKTEFLAQMSHEIRTPINSIMSYSQLLKDEVIDLVPEELRFSFDMINNGGRRLIRTVDLILNMSELQTGSYEVIVEKFDITNVLKQLVGEFQTAANSKKLDLIYLNRLDAEQSFIRADIYTITQIFANLIDNAVKYTNKGSIEVISYLDEELKLCMDVQDSGIGISMKFQKELFEAFTQEEQGYTRKFDGNGLGMALVKEYCKLNNAKISVKSEKDKGSTFTVVFPEAILESETRKIAV
ncbi:MAG: HAMP domain-containing histidine kinase [Ignavibacteriae bacterium]|nr:HAMP domain-containing histidine kinase [Ignavibacteriota bacterium]